MCTFILPILGLYSDSILIMMSEFHRADGFDYEADFDVIMTNLEHNVHTVNELSKDSSLTENQVSKLNYIMTTIMKSETTIKGSFGNEAISQFVIKSVQATSLDRASIIEPYVSEFLNSNEYESFVLELDLTKSQFDAVLQKIIHKYDLNKIDTKINKKFFKNKSNLIDSVGIKYLDKIGKFDGDLKNLMDSFRLILLAIKSKEELLSDEVTDLLSDGRCFESKLFDLQLKLINDENLTNLVTKKVQPLISNENLCLSSNLNELTDNYKHTLAEKDLEIYSKLRQLDPELNCLLFSRVSKLSKSNDLEQKQAKISDFIALKIEETIMINSMRNFPIKRKLLEKYESFDSNVYDPVYMLANLYDLLDYVANLFSQVEKLKIKSSKCLKLNCIMGMITSFYMSLFKKLNVDVEHLVEDNTD
ncbi:hypothetical protein BpHYR1_036925 [Brachionus plicatilis]|uniref:Uncharacterized protein n=1 Tax=Brachionus plicatilis TaxID=10195 RepID=A0A3M7RWV6_BRAPC|nr:hypothetical protein BpHYR1_036925 [Brachionus plicatilis]